MGKPGEGVEVHTIDCHQLASGLDSDWIDLSWGTRAAGAVGRLRVTLYDRPGTLAEMAGICAQNQCNVKSLAQTQMDHPFTTYEIALEVQDVAHLERTLSALRASDAVAQAETSCAAGDPARASETLRAASARWSEAEDYAHCMLPHESTDAVTEAFRRAIRTVETGDASAAADIDLLRVRIQGLADGERITLGNIF